MKKLYFTRQIGKIINVFLMAFILLLSVYSAHSQSFTFKTRSYIINMGIVPQTTGNGLKPYGLIYELIKTYQVPVYWVINSSKVKDGTDFTYNSVAYKGGTFIIPADYITTAVAARITVWNGLGVSGAYTTTELTQNYAYRLTSMPTWTLDDQNGGIATGFFANAGIPATSYNWLAPSLLGPCNDVFVMPHADPKWATHGNLYNWNDTYNGSIWLGCHAVSALENMYNPADISQQTNFLSNKVTTAGPGIILPVPGSTNYSQNSLVLWGAHSGATIPYNTITNVPGPAPQSGTLATPSDPVAQYMGISDLAHLNGSEQVYLPVLGGSYRSSTKIICYDPTQADVPLKSPGPAVIIAYGHGFGELNRGYVMYEAGHSIAKGSAGDVPAQRAFFNWSLLAAVIKQPVISSITGIPPDGKFSAQPYPQSYPLSVSYSSPISATMVKFTWICRRADTGAEVGSFTPNGNNAASTTTFTPPNSLTDINVLISIKIEDECGRSAFEAFPAIVKACNVSVTTAVTNPSCYGGSNGSIALTIAGGTATNTWTWTRTNPAGGPVNGNGTSITGLSGGTYSITVTTSSGCTASATALVSQPVQLAANASVIGVSCYGSSSGSINLTVTGGTPAYTFNWEDLTPPPVEPEDRVNVPAGTYSVTVTDSKGCTATSSAVIGQPGSGLTVTGTVTDVSCNGLNNGIINITASGGTGTGTYTYDWGGGVNSEDRSGLAAGTYNVQVTDANGCTATATFTVTQPAVLSLSLVLNQPDCPAPGPYNSLIDLSVNGGTGPYSYDWDNDGLETPDDDTQDLTNVGPGTYTVIVTDARGCIATISATLTATSAVPNPPAGINH